MRYITHPGFLKCVWYSLYLSRDYNSKKMLFISLFTIFTVTKLIHQFTSKLSMLLSSYPFLRLSHFLYLWSRVLFSFGASSFSFFLLLPPSLEIPFNLILPLNVSVHRELSEHISSDNLDFASLSSHYTIINQSLKHLEYSMM